MKTHDFNFYLNRLSKIFFIHQPKIIYDRIISSFSISLSYPRMHSLPLLFSFLWYVLGSVANPQQLLTIPIVYCYLCLPFLKNNRTFYINFAFRFEKHLFLKYFKNDFKIFCKYFFIVIVLYILENRCV